MKVSLNVRVWSARWQQTCMRTLPKIMVFTKSAVTLLPKSQPLIEPGFLPFSHYKPTIITVASLKRSYPSLIHSLKWAYLLLFRMFRL